MVGVRYSVPKEVNVSKGYPKKNNPQVYDLPVATADPPVTLSVSGDVSDIFGISERHGYDWCEVTIGFYKQGVKVRQVHRQEGTHRP